MKPHPRIRKTVKWGGAAVTMLLVVVWIGSCYVTVVSSGVYARFALREGTLDIQYYSAGSPFVQGRWIAPIDLRTRTIEWWEFVVSRGADFRGGVVHVVTLSVWAFVAAPAVAACTAWRLDVLARRRARLNLCPKCNYDRTGLAAGAVCPECGSGGAAPASSSSTA